VSKDPPRNSSRTDLKFQRLAGLVEPYFSFASQVYWEWRGGRQRQACCRRPVRATTV